MPAPTPAPPPAQIPQIIVQAPPSASLSDMLNPTNGPLLILLILGIVIWRLLPDLVKWVVSRGTVAEEAKLGIEAKMRAAEIARLEAAISKLQIDLQQSVSDLRAAQTTQIEDLEHRLRADMQRATADLLRAERPSAPRPRR